MPQVLCTGTRGDPYHYVRLQAIDERTTLLIVGGEDHKTGQADDTDERYARLEAWARERFPMMGAVEFAWAGQVHGDASTASPSSAATRWTTTTSTSPPATRAWA